MELLAFHYTNYKGISSDRVVKPIEVWFGRDGFHPSSQWLLKAFCTQRKAERNFALSDMVIKGVDYYVNGVVDKSSTNLHHLRELGIKVLMF